MEGGREGIPSRVGVTMEKRGRQKKKEEGGRRWKEDQGEVRRFLKLKKGERRPSPEKTQQGLQL